MSTLVTHFVGQVVNLRPIANRPAASCTNLNLVRRYVVQLILAAAAFQAASSTGSAARRSGSACKRREPAESRLQPGLAAPRRFNIRLAAAQDRRGARRTEWFV